MESKTSRPRISVIIPAANEEKFLPLAFASLEKQTFPRRDFEIIVSVNGSRDHTFEYAKAHADGVEYSESPLTPALARNRGAGIAKGDIFVFLDADSTLSPNTLSRIAEVCGGDVAGSVWCAPDTRRLSAQLFMTMKNVAHVTRFHNGVGGGLFFVDARAFRRTGGFSSTKRVSEFQELVARLKQDGVRYTFIADAIATTSTRRFEKEGMLKTIWFWVRWWFSWKMTFLFGRDTKEAKVAEEYHQ